MSDMPDAGGRKIPRASRRRVVRRANAFCLTLQPDSCMLNIPKVLSPFSGTRKIREPTSLAARLRKARRFL
jgi:hypothetical protein